MQLGCNKSLSSVSGAHSKLLHLEESARTTGRAIREARDSRLAMNERQRSAQTAIPICNPLQMGSLAPL